MEPLTFTPLYMERIWGGRELERFFNRQLPDAQKPYGEAWEIVDRAEAQSVVASGDFAGKSLNELWTNHREEIFGEGFPNSVRFQILIKILDARDDLSIQVHPPAAIAAELKGEPKTEMWFIVDCDSAAKLYVGLKSGVTRSDFEKSIAAGAVADCVHAISPNPGDSIFIESGRLHAIGAGFLIYEIQQNSDTTYRVFDWNRLGLDGEPRQLHVDESLASIDFDDIEPTMDLSVGDTLATCEYFKTERKFLQAGEVIDHSVDDSFSILAVVDGALQSSGGEVFEKGKFLLWPRHGSPLHALSNSTILQITLPRPSITAQLATLLRRRMLIIADHAWRDRDAAGQLAALQSVSEEISAWTLAHRTKVDARLRHFLANASYEKALHHVEAADYKLEQL